MCKKIKMYAPDTLLLKIVRGCVLLQVWNQHCPERTFPTWNFCVVITALNDYQMTWMDPVCVIRPMLMHWTHSQLNLDGVASCKSKWETCPAIKCTILVNFIWSSDHQYLFRFYRWNQNVEPDKLYATSTLPEKINRGAFHGRSTTSPVVECTPL